MPTANYKLISKENLTYDVFKMVFECEEDIKTIPGQFTTFLLPSTWFARAYSILNQEWNKFEYIIRRLENGRWWSKEICDKEVWTILKWVWSVWKFLLKDTFENKLFICTWTWLVPFYFQIKTLFENNFSWNYKLIIWNRKEEDLYYLDEFSKFKSEKFDYEVYLSQEENEKYNKWRVGDFIMQENVSKFKEFYICWNPLMIDEVILRLKEFWVEDDNIITEKY